MERHGSEAERGWDARLLRLEEAAAYSDRAAETLSAEIAELGRRLELVARRLAALETRISEPLRQAPDAAPADGAPIPGEPSESP